MIFTNRFRKYEAQDLQAGQLKILVITPAYNEEGNIAKTINEVLSLPFSLDVLVVNDGSKDNTSYEVKQTKAKIISLPFNLGIGGAVQTGFKYAYQKGYDIALQVDGDGQHDAGFIQAIVDPIINDEADMTIGSRFIPPFLGYQSSFLRRVGINFFACLISSITKYKITDPTSGFRAYNKKMIKIFSEYYPHDYPEPEAIAVAGRFQARIQEVPVQMRKRAAGSSSIRYMRTLYYMIKVTFAILLDKLKQKGY